MLFMVELSKLDPHLETFESIDNNEAHEMLG